MQSMKSDQISATFSVFQQYFILKTQWNDIYVKKLFREEIKVLLSPTLVFCVGGSSDGDPNGREASG